MGKPVKKVKPVKKAKAVKKVKKVKAVKTEQLSLDGRPPWVPHDPIWCGICRRSVTLKPNGECPMCHHPLVGEDEVPF